MTHGISMLLVDEQKPVARSTVWRRANPERSRAYFREYYRKWRAANIDKVRITVRDSKRRKRRTEKLACITAYGGRCVCCGETEPYFLTIDHINNDGARHRKTIDKKRAAGGTEFYQWLRVRGYPKDRYRLMCFNCNCGRHWNGGICPHQEAKAA